MKLFYVGNKETKNDPFFNSGIVWKGFGDCKEVPDENATMFLKHTNVWTDGPGFERLVKDVDVEDVDLSSVETLTAVPESEPTKEESKPTVDSTRIEVIQGAIMSLDINNPEVLTARKTPKVDLVREAASDDSITADEVKHAWSALNGND